MGIEFMALLAGCPSPHNTGRQQDRSLDTSVYDTGIDDSGDSAGDTSVNTEDSGEQNSAPIITTNSLPNAVTQSAYNTFICTTDADVQYALVSGPSWIQIDARTGVLSGIPTQHKTENIEVIVTDPAGLFDTKQYSLTVDPIATVEMKVIDGGDGSSADSSCSIDVLLTNSSSGYAETARVVDGIAAFSLDEIGTYDISVPSTNTGSTCYGGVSQSEWLDVVADSQSSWVTLIPETYQDEVRDVVGEQLDMEDIYGHVSGDVDNVTKLVKYTSSVHSLAPYTAGWDDAIRTDTTPLEVNTIDYTYDGLQYNDALELAIGYWDSHLAPSIQQVTSGGEIRFTRGSNWQTDYNYDGSGYIISDCEIEYTVVGDDNVNTAAKYFSHEMGHCLRLRHTEVDNFIMASSPMVAEPHELEKLVTRVLNNIGSESPSGNRIDLYNGYLE